jgi:murein DD-endopeptidase MepM/ murein hydrolase activator NlpD
MHRRSALIALAASLSLAFGSTASNAQGQASGAPAAPSVAARPAHSRPSVAIVAPQRLRQGDPLLAWIVVAAAGTDLVASGKGPVDERATGMGARLLDPDGKEVARSTCFVLRPLPEVEPSSAVEVQTLGALFALPTDLAPGSYTLVAGRGDESEATASVLVLARSFPLETIPLDESNTAIRNLPSKRKDDEARRLFALLDATDYSAVFADLSPFLFPVQGGFKSAGFGDRRRYLLATGGSELSAHAGLDWAVVKGTVVRACARGKVVLVADREVTGKTVVLEHLPGLYSLYFHLSSIEATEGGIVERGERIALSGSTGMSTGPHLHWELRARGDAVDPEHWLGTALLDTEAIKATISALIEGR